MDRKAAVLILAFAVVTMGQDDCATTTEDAPVQDQSPSNDKQAKPKAEYDLTCDYVLGDFNESGDPTKGFRFLGGGTIRNTGNVGIRVRATFRWKQLGAAPIVKRKTFRVPAGREKDVNLTVPATPDQIDLHQSAEGDCTARAAIVGKL